MSKAATVAKPKTAAPASAKPTLAQQIKAAKAGLSNAHKGLTAADKAKAKAQKAHDAARDKLEKLENKQKASAASK